MPGKAFTLPRLTMSTVKDVIYIITILLSVLFYFRDKATKQAVLDNKIDTMVETQHSILEKFKENDVKWENQKETNGKFTMYIELDSH